MDKFSAMKPKDNIFFEDKNKNILFQNDNVKLIDFEDWTIVKERDLVVCIVYLIETNQFIIRHEYIPTFKYVDGQEYHVTLISGGIEKHESPEMALLRELEEEAGLVLRPDFKLEPMKPLYISKGQANKYYPYLISLTENDYHEVLAKGDGSRSEKLSKSVKVDKKYINNLMVSDLITEYMLLKLKDFLNL